jgi:hypothetical protein
MVSVFGFVALSILVRGVVVVGAALILGTTVPRMPNKLSRFVLAFALWVPLGFIYDESKPFVHHYSPVPLLDYPRMSWTVALIYAFLCALFTTFLWPQSRSSLTR